MIFVDRFGNAVTNLVGARGGTVELGTLAIDLRRTYAEVEAGKPLALVGSTGFVEIAVRNGDAARTLGLKRGSIVALRTAH